MSRVLRGRLASGAALPEPPVSTPTLHKVLRATADQITLKDLWAKADQKTLKGWSVGNTKLLESGIFSDVTVTCKERSWKLHKAIICTRSTFFAKALQGDFKESKMEEVTIEGWTPEQVDWIIRYIYTFELPLSLTAELCHMDKALEKYLEVYKLADYFAVDDLSARCLENLRKYLWEKARQYQSHQHDNLDCFIRTFAAVATEVYNMPKSSSHKIRQELVNYMRSTAFGPLKSNQVLGYFEVVPLFMVDVAKVMLREYIPALDSPICYGCRKPNPFASVEVSIHGTRKNCKKI